LAKNYLPALGFRRVEGRWTRESKRGLVVVDLKPKYHVRAALLGLLVRIIG
jgi:hypothetical protein